MGKTYKLQENTRGINFREDGQVIYSCVCGSEAWLLFPITGLQWESFSKAWRKIHTRHKAQKYLEDVLPLPGAVEDGETV